MDCRYAIIRQPLQLEGTIFTEDARFEETTFVGGAFLTRASFAPDTKAYFIEADFEGGGYFYGVRFDGDTEFTRATFEGGVDFIDTCGEPAGVSGRSRVGSPVHPGHRRLGFVVGLDLLLGTAARAGYRYVRHSC